MVTCWHYFPALASNFRVCFEFWLVPVTLLRLTDALSNSFQSTEDHYFNAACNVS